MDFIKKVRDYLTNELDLFASINFGLLGDENSIAIRPTPASTPEKLLKGQVNNYQFQILTKHETGYTAYQELEKITKELDGLKWRDIKSEDNSFTLIKCELYNTPNWVEETDGGYQVYTAIFRAELDT